MKVEFRTLDGAIAVREVAEPLPPTLKVPIYCYEMFAAIESATAMGESGWFESREYRLMDSPASPCNPFYVEVYHAAPAPAHAAEIDRLAQRIKEAVEGEDEFPGDTMEFKRAIADLLPLKKRYFAPPNGENFVLNKLLADERAAVAQLRSQCDTLERALSEECVAAAALHKDLAAERAAHAETKRERNKWASLATQDDGAVLRSALKEFLA